jgi:hypothetical protein
MYELLEQTYTISLLFNNKNAGKTDVSSENFDSYNSSWWKNLFNSPYRYVTLYDVRLRLGSELQ